MIVRIDLGIAGPAYAHAPTATINYDNTKKKTKAKMQGWASHRDNKSVGQEPDRYMPTLSTAPFLYSQLREQVTYEL